MDADQWGAHTRKHFEHDGYEVCMTEDGKQRPRHACPVKKVINPVRTIGNRSMTDEFAVSKDSRLIANTLSGYIFRMGIVIQDLG